MAIAGFILGVYQVQETGAGVTYPLHYWLGIAVTALLVVQVLSAVALRPAPWSKLRNAWNLQHWWLGRAAVLLALVSINEGFNILQPGTGWVAALWSVFGAIVLVGLAKEAYDHLQKPPPKRTPSDSDSNDNTSSMNGKGKAIDAESTHVHMMLGKLLHKRGGNGAAAGGADGAGGAVNKDAMSQSDASGHGADRM